ncbi:hypothetical protein GCM10022297_01460 [Lactobacillus hamsteri]|uniref:Uncharacterized protein n=1 Tax=Lactobacillus hamsteri DSM 5661 = JCM 6256 TaxID=1423754 RepID=A0A0R1YCA6_9LACO|nr:hypothetical protein [Lactobacillus hamsteri]KRM37030.1 hypothetical protein FC39_GL000482 [Lactobacillus hamsteri DSM 5661 = JCM 6256]
MGLLSKILNIVNNSKPLSNQQNDIENKQMWQEFNKLEEMRPDFYEIIGRPTDFPKYTDRYETNTNFTMRELLLLVWYGKVKKGRLINTRIPKYFFYDYNLNGVAVTHKFIKQNLLIEHNDRYVLSDEAKRIVDFYNELWEIHTTKEFPTCLDEDFETWEHGKALIPFYEKEIIYLKKDIIYVQADIEFSQKYPDFPLSAQNLDQIINFKKEDIERDKKRIAICQDRIKALSD